VKKCLPRVCSFALAAIVCLFVAVPSLWAGGFPVEGKGDIDFQADCATFLGPQNGIEEEFYIKVRSDQLNFERKNKKIEALVLLTISYVNELGDVYETKTKEFKPRLEDAPARDDSNLFMVRYPITNAAKKIRISLEDLRARRRGIFYLFTKERKKGFAEADIVLSAPLPGTLSMSDIQLAWSISPSKPEDTGSFEKSGFNVIPNPSRSYGLRRGTVFAYFEVYDETELAAQTGKVFYNVATSILNSDREAVLSDTQKVVSSSRQWVQTVAMDLSKLSAGNYWLRAEIWQTNGQDRLLREKEFSVLWYDASWRKSDRDVLDEASLFLDNKQLKQFRKMNTGEREKFLDEFWKRLDPTPETAMNEVRDEFDRRVAYANAQFSFFTKGMLSDRGRVYIKYGEPDVIEKQVVPTSGDAADVLLSQSPVLDNIQRKNTPKQVGNDRRAYEIWIYNMRGNPLFPDLDRPMTQTLGMKFLFVDDTGAGNFILESSSDKSNQFR